MHFCSGNTDVDAGFCLAFKQVDGLERTDHTIYLMAGMCSVRKTLLHLRGPRSSLWFLVIVAFVLRVVVAFLTSGADYDIASYHIQAQTVLNHQNVYAVTDRYPYPPLWIWFVALAQWTTAIKWISFGWLVKSPGILGDCLTVVLLRRYKSGAAALFYAVNPVSIIITAGHGQFDGLVLALVVASWALWRTQPNLQRPWAALALGGAIALKGYPILLLPALLIGVPSNKQRARLTLWALAPLVGITLFYIALFGLEPTMVSNILGYKSFPYFGWAPYVYVLLHNLWLSGYLALEPWLSWSARVLVLTVPLVLVYKLQKRPLEQLWLATFLTFYALAPGLAAQYLLWVLPLLALVNLKKGLWYSVLAFPLLVCFYLNSSPEAVPWGQRLATIVPASAWLGYYLLLNLVWWLYCLWLIRTTFRAGAPDIKTHAFARSKSLNSSRLESTSLVDASPFCQRGSR